MDLPRSSPDDAEAARHLERYTRGMFTHLIVALARSLRAEDLSLSEIAALHLIEREGELKIGELARELGFPMPAASRIASQLVQHGLVDRREAPPDLRVRTLSLSRKGRELIDRTSRERVVAALAAAASMPGAISQTIGSALRKLLDETTEIKETQK